MSGPRRLHVDGEGAAQNASDAAFNLGLHVVKRGGIDFQVNDAQGLDVATVHVGDNSAAVVSLMHTTPLRRTRIGLVYTLSTEGARETAAALIECAAELEAAAAEQAREALAKARGK